LFVRLGPNTDEVAFDSRFITGQIEEVQGQSCFGVRFLASAMLIEGE